MINLIKWAKNHLAIGEHANITVFKKLNIFPLSIFADKIEQCILQYTLQLQKRTNKMF